MTMLIQPSRLPRTKCAAYICAQCLSDAWLGPWRTHRALYTTAQSRNVTRSLALAQTRSFSRRSTAVFGAVPPASITTQAPAPLLGDGIKSRLWRFGAARQKNNRPRYFDPNRASLLLQQQQQQQQQQHHPAAIDGGPPQHALQQAPVQRPARRRHQTTAVGTTAVEDTDTAIPSDASARLSALSTAFPARSLRRLLSVYLALSKPRLSFLIVLTTTTAYSLYPVPDAAAAAAATTALPPSLSTATLLFLTTGTALASASANAFNMLLEPQYDAKMSRTRNRPLVRKLVTPRAAAVFAVLAGAAGLGLLLYGVNPTVAALGGLNILLYAGVYTPMKRISVINTWIGAVVGGIPPLMGWVAAAGQYTPAIGTSTNDGSSSSGDVSDGADPAGWRQLLLGPQSAGGWLLAALLFAWQFPHFNALSWSIRDEYRAAGYRMLAWVDARRNARVALRYALLTLPLCAGLCAAGVTDRGFLLSSSAANAWLVAAAWRFWRRGGAAGSARALFWASVWHLPVVMVLAMLHKKGLWQRVWRACVGEGEEEEEEYDHEDENTDDEEEEGEKEEERRKPQTLT